MGRETGYVLCSCTHIAVVWQEASLPHPLPFPNLASQSPHSIIDCAHVLARLSPSDSLRSARLRGQDGGLS